MLVYNEEKADRQGEFKSQMIKLGPGALVRLWIKYQVPRRHSQDSHPKNHGR